MEFSSIDDDFVVLLLLKERKERKYWVHPILKYREDGEWMNLTIAILDFGVRFYGGSELSKHLSKCLPRMRKTQKIKPDPNFFMMDENFGGSV